MLTTGNPIVRALWLKELKHAIVFLLALSVLVAAACSSNDACSSDPCSACQDPCTQADSCSSGSWTCDCSCPDESNTPVVIEGSDASTTTEGSDASSQTD